MQLAKHERSKDSLGHAGRREGLPKACVVVQAPMKPPGLTE